MGGSPQMAEALGIDGAEIRNAGEALGELNGWWMVDQRWINVGEGEASALQPSQIAATTDDSCCGLFCEGGSS